MEQKENSIGTEYKRIFIKYWNKYLIFQATKYADVFFSNITCLTENIDLVLKGNEELVQPKNKLYHFMRLILYNIFLFMIKPILYRQWIRKSFNKGTTISLQNCYTIQHITYFFHMWFSLNQIVAFTCRNRKNTEKNWFIQERLYRTSRLFSVNIVIFGSWNCDYISWKFEYVNIKQL